MRICPRCRPIHPRIRNRPGVVPLAVVPAAGVAQLVEQLIRNQQVRGSSPRAGSNKITYKRLMLDELLPTQCEFVGRRLHSVRR
jgi:hypothetical protein